MADADPAHAVMNPTRSQPFLGNDKAASLRSQQVFLGNPAGLIENFAMAEIIAAGMTHDGDVPHQVKPGVSVGTMIMLARR